MLRKIINSGLLTCVSLLLSFSWAKDGFKDAQLRNQRVKNAYSKKWETLKALLEEKQIKTNDFDLYIRAFKYEGELELFVKNTGENQYRLLKTIPICAKSGGLGPKRKQGDGQVPEGFYEITAFNPNSNYHLSLKVGYPNKSDRIKSSTDPGGDIMIHGFCVTIGCIPLQNDPVEELYVLSVEARHRNRTIRSDIFPYRFSNNNRVVVEKNRDQEVIRFWKSLEKAHLYFEQTHILPKITTDQAGNYLVNAI